MSLQVEIEKKLNDKVLSVSFDTEGKQGITGILGASGCGKSMTLKCIAGIETPDRGKIVLNGRVLFDSGKKINLRVQDRHVGYLFQNYALFPNMTVEKNIAAGFQYRPGQKMSAEEIKKQTADYMELLHVTELKSSYPGKLSGGQQQRVALARILASDPEVLMLDEPFSALDAFLKEKLQLELLELLSGYDKDILMVTHSRDEIYRFCEHMLIVEDGRQAGFGVTKEIFKNPGTPAAAKLTGCKNIEKIERVDDHTMVLPNWNTTVCVKGMIPENTTHIGIRAHYLRLPENGQRENLVGYIDTKIGTKKTCMLYCAYFAFGILCNLLSTFWLPLVYVSIFVVGTSLGGCTNMTLSYPASLFGVLDYPKVNGFIFPICYCIGCLNFVVNAVALKITGSLTGAYIVYLGLFILNVIIVALTESGKWDKNLHPELFHQK